MRDLPDPFGPMMHVKVLKGPTTCCPAYDLKLFTTSRSMRPMASLLRLWFAAQKEALAFAFAFAVFPFPPLAFKNTKIKCRLEIKELLWLSEDHLENMLIDTDFALYKAKKTGRNKVICFREEKQNDN